MKEYPKEKEEWFKKCIVRKAAQAQLQLALKTAAEETQCSELYMFMEGPWQVTVLKLPPLFSLSAA